MTKVMVVGLDGADWELIMPWVRAGKLPHLQRLLAEGCYGPLASISPPLTFPAWVSFSTGVNPGRHGVLDFFARIPGQFRVRLYNAMDIQEERFWHRLSRENKTVGIVGMPVNYPIEPLNGIVLPGFDTPGIGGGKAPADHMYPQSLYRELEEHCGGYWVVPNLVAFGPHQMSQAAERIKFVTVNKGQVVDYLLTSRNWDCFVFVLGETDSVCHHFWRFHDPASPLYESDPPELRDTIFAIYRQADEILGRLLELLPPDGHLVMVSDHGMGGTSDKVIHLNLWLAQEGFLTYKEQVWKKTWWRQAQRRLLHAARDLGRRYVPHALKKFLFRKTDLIDRLESHLRYAAIDWDHTLAYSDEGFHFPSIRINLEGVEPRGRVRPGKEYEQLREKIAAKLLEWEDPYNGARVVHRVYRREELYSGPQACHTPDLVIDWHQDGAYGYLWRPSAMAQEGRPIERLDLSKSSERRFVLNRSGRHRHEGIFLGYGPAFPPGREVNGLSIMDMAPLILYLNQVSIPAGLDGRLPTDIMKGEYLQEHPPQYDSHSETGRTQEAKPYKSDEAQEIEDRLRSLGYLE